ncbi:MAG: ribbon-helix-helix protein, CopG family [Desulfobacterales bacterium]
MKDMIGVRVPKEIKAALERLAAQENRSVSNYVYNALLVYLKEHAGIDVDKLVKK